MRNALNINARFFLCLGVAVLTCGLAVGCVSDEADTELESIESASRADEDADQERPQRDEEAQEDEGDDERPAPPERDEERPAPPERDGEQGERPEPGACEDRCEEVARTAFRRCNALEDSTPRRCAGVARRVLERCASNHCEEEADREETCQYGCIQRGRALAEVCFERTEDREACVERAQEFTRQCMAEHCEAPDQDGEMSCQMSCAERVRGFVVQCAEDTDDREACTERGARLMRHCVAEACTDDERPERGEDERPPREERPEGERGE